MLITLKNFIFYISTVLSFCQKATDQQFSLTLVINFLQAELGACETCADLTAPSGTDQTCEFKNGKKKCTHKCATEGELFSLATATPASISIKCKCPKVDGVKTCGWLSGKLGGQVDQATLSGLTCAAAPTTAGPGQYF